MSAPDDGIMGRLPRERPGTRSAKRATGGPAGSGAREPRSSSKPPVAPNDPLRDAARLAGQAAEAGVRAAARVAGGILGRLPRR